MVKGRGTRQGGGGEQRRMRWVEQEGGRCN